MDSNEQYAKDEQSIANTEQGIEPLNLAAFKRLMISDLTHKTNILNDYKVAGYSIEKIKTFLDNPQKHYGRLIQISRYMMKYSPFYMRINNYFANMPLFNYCIDSYDIKYPVDDNVKNKLKNDYYRINAQFEKMNLKHELAKIMDILPSEDVYCGVFFEDKSDFFIQRLPIDMCDIHQIQDGLYNFRIRLSNINAVNLGWWPSYIQQAYLDHMELGEYPDGWYTPPADMQICLKFNESVPYPLPFMISLAKDIFDVDIYKKLKLQKARVDNYKAIIMEIPIDTNTVDKPLLTNATLSTMAEMNKLNMPDDVGLIHSLGQAEAVSFKDNSNTTNNLGDAINNIYDYAGVPQQVFGSATTNAALKTSIENDASYVYRLYRQVERYMNRFIKLRRFNKANYKFAFRLQNSTIFNRESVVDFYLKAAERGLPFKMDYAVSLGVSQGRVLGNICMENDVFELQNYLIPLPTSYTMTTKNIGRPTNESQGLELTESGASSAENGSNDSK